MKKIIKNPFLPKDLSYFDDSNKLITIEDDTATDYKVILTMGSVLFIIGLGLLFFGDSGFGIFFLFISTVFFLAKGLYYYLDYLKYKDISLTLHHKNLKIGKTLRGYATISVPCENKDFKIVLKNEYVYEKRTRSNNRTSTTWYRDMIWSYETKGYVKVEGSLTYVYFKIPIANDTSATKIIRNGYEHLRREFAWTLVLKEDGKYFPLSRNYKLKIRK